MPMKPPPQSWLGTCPSFQKDSSSPFRILLSLYCPPQETTELLFVIMHWFTYINVIIHAPSFSHSGQCLWDSLTSLRVSVAHSFLSLSTIPLHGLHRSWFSHSSVNAHFFLKFLAVVKEAAINIYIQVIVWTYVFIILRSRISVMSFWNLRQLWLREIT